MAGAVADRCIYKSKRHYDTEQEHTDELTDGMELTARI